MSELAQAITGARRRAGAVVFIHGEPGTGKSKLLAVADELARAGRMRVLRGAGRELEREFPFGVAIQLIESESRVSRQARSGPSDGEPANLIEQLLDGAPADIAGATPGAHFAVIHRLFSFSRELAARGEESGGLAVVVDDAHWVDQPSLAFLAYLAQRVADMPIALIVASCDGAPATSTAALGALRKPPCVALRTTDLSSSGVAAVIRATFPAAGLGFSVACARVTRGNPFLLTELLAEALRIGLDPGAGTTGSSVEALSPQPVLEWVRRQLLPMPAEATALIDALAAIGEPATVAQTADVAGLDAATAARAAEALAAAHLLDHHVRLSFAHPLVGSVLSASIPAAQRDRLRLRTTTPEERAPMPAADSPEVPAPRRPTTPRQRLALAEMTIRSSVNGGHRDQVRNLAMLAWDDGSLLDATQAGGAIPTLLSEGLLHVDELEHCLTILDHPRFAALQRDAPVVRAEAGCCRAWALYHQGQVSLALAEAEAAIGALPREQRSAAHRVNGALAACWLQRGQLGQADAALSTLIRSAELTQIDRSVLLDTRAQLRLAQGRPQDGLQDALAAGLSLQSASTSADQRIVAWRSTAALANIALDESRDARRLADEELELARAREMPRTMIRALRVQARTLGGMQGLELLAEAVAVGKRSPMRLEYIEALVDLGAAIRRANRRSDARGPLNQALELCGRLGATAIAARARQELAATRGRTRRSQKTGIEVLTPSERRVAMLAAEGRTTREIAAELFVTPKTVEFHLRHIYLKLDVPSSRSELIRALTSQHGLSPI